MVVCITNANEELHPEDDDLGKLALTYWHSTANEGPVLLSSMLQLHRFRPTPESQSHLFKSRWAISMLSQQICSSISKSIRDCQLNHKICGSNQHTSLARVASGEDHNRQISSTLMPRRLIDTKPDQSQTRIKVVSCSDIGRVEYVTLSYSWGGKTTTMLTNENLHTLANGVDICSLPRTIQDAISLTWRLNYCYLWVDALCIKQLDQDEWSQEASRMGDIYSGGILNLAATNSIDSEEGFGFLRNPLQVLACRLDLALGLPWTLDISYCLRHRVETAYLQSRGWVLQEQALSPRTVHFGPSLIRWECRETTICESSERPGECLCLLWPSIKSRPNFGTDLRDSRHFTLKHFRWYWERIVHLYTNAQLTRWEDRPIALAGLEGRLQACTGFTCAFGLWFEMMPSSLNWYFPVRAERIPNVAPTWSWLGLRPLQIQRQSLGIAHGVMKSHRTQVIHMVEVSKYPAPRNLDDTTPWLQDNTDYQIKLRSRLQTGVFNIDRAVDRKGTVTLTEGKIIVDVDVYDETPQDGDELSCLMLCSLDTTLDWADSPVSRSEEISDPEHAEEPEHGGHPEHTGHLEHTKQPEHTASPAQSASLEDDVGSEDGRYPKYNHHLLVLRPSPTKPGVFRRIGVIGLNTDSDCSDWTVQEVEIE